MKSVAFTFSLLFSVCVFSQQSIIPRPVTVKKPAKQAFFQLDPATTVLLEGSGLDFPLNFLNQYLQTYYGFRLQTSNQKTGNNMLRLNFDRLDHPIPGAYNLDIDKQGIRIAGDNETGVFYGIQTLIQMLPLPAENNAAPKLALPYISITDMPRFAYRGMHLDCGRHFWPVTFIKKYLDYLALHKLNIFHWHLTEDQGWRMEIKQYPELTRTGSQRNGTITGRYPGSGNDQIPYGGFYTQEEIKEVLQYAAERYIEVIPEIEMPGHSSAAIASYPWLSCFPDKPTAIPASMISKKSLDELKNGRIKLVQETWGVFDDVFCAGNDATFLFLQNVLDEVTAIFPSRYVHIGGDECPKTHWKQCPRCQQRIKDHNLKDEHELQSWFVQRIEKYLNSKGKTLIGWDEILEGGLAPNAIVMSWRGEKGGIEAAKQKHQVIMTPGNPVYFDHTQSENEDSVTIGGYNPIEKVYAYEPIPKELTGDERNYVLGAQANVWTEYMKNTAKVEYMIFPRMAALSETLWSPPGLKDWTDFEKRLMTQLRRYELWNASYSRAFFDIRTTVIPDAAGKGIAWKLETRAKNTSIRYMNDVSPLMNYSKPVPVRSSRNLSAFAYRDNKQVSSVSQKFTLHKAAGKTITLAAAPSKTYPGDGAFTLVNAVINEKGIARSREFLGFSGQNCEAVIDMGQLQEISYVVLHCLRRESSWIWQPQSAEVFGSADGKTWQSLKQTDQFREKPGSSGKGFMELPFRKTFVRYLKLVASNQGDIPAGHPGAGKKAWMFVDEIEIN